MLEKIASRRLPFFHGLGWVKLWNAVPTADWHPPYVTRSLLAHKTPDGERLCGFWTSATGRRVVTGACKGCKGS